MTRMQIKNARKKGKSPRTRQWAKWGSASFLKVCTWHLEGWLQTAKSHEGEKQLTETGQGHFDI